MGSRSLRLLPLAAVLATAGHAAAAPQDASASPPAAAPAPTRAAPSPPPPAAKQAVVTPPAKSEPPKSEPPKPQAAKPAPAKPAAKTPARRPAPAASAKSTTGPTRATRSPDTSVRQKVAGGPTVDDVAAGADTPELRALHLAERELFPPASPAVGSPWPAELPFPLAAPEDRPRVHASGLPPSPPPSAPPSESGKDLSWLSNLEMPDIPVRWDARVVRYLEFFKNDPRGRGTLTTFLRRSGRYRDMMRRVFRQKGLPEDLVWLAMIESGFDPTARSPVGALGLWQFMPETGKIYGLTHDRWADLRMSPTQATEAAADFLADLHRRFGSWDLAMAAYNMGYGGMLAVVRRYNTNDYWALSRLEGSLPWETTLYVPKILAAAVVARNLATFGFQDVAVEPPLEGEEVPVAPGTTLGAVAQACGATTKELEQLNPELRASRTPPAQDDWPVRVPAGKASACSQNLARHRREQAPVERYVVRFGESLEQIAEARHVPVSKIVELNGIAPGEVLRGGTTILVPKGEGGAESPPGDGKRASAGGDKPVVIVPQDVFVYPDRRRLFYRVHVGDTIRDVCAAFDVTPDEVRRWNTVDTSARLVEGMTLQLYVRKDKDLSNTVVLGESDVHTIVVGTEDFFQHWDDKGRRRVVVSAKAGETIADIGKKHGVSSSLMERINRRSRSEVLSEGEQVIVWLPPAAGATAKVAAAAPPVQGEPSPTEPLADPPAPDRLPPLP